MRYVNLLAIFILLAGYGLRAHAADVAAYPDAYNVVWTSPSIDATGSMPIGNGDIGLNVWVEKGGDLLFFIGKTDAWSENVRLLKLGRVRVKLSPNPFAAGVPFRQELRLRQGEIVIQAGKPGEEVTLTLWVDANQPVIHLEATGARSFTLQANLEIWRTEPQHTLTDRELFSACGMNGAPHPLVESGDVVLPATGNRLYWYHRNATSVWAETLQLQGLRETLARGNDPLLHRTFGGAIAGIGLASTAPNVLASPTPRMEYRLSVYPYTAQTATVAAWQAQLTRVISRIDKVPIARARAAHRDWWQAFWQRSHIQVSVSNPEDALRPRTLPAITTAHLPLSFGATIHGNETFTGDMDRVRVYGRALAATEIAAHAQRRALPDGRETASCVGDWSFDDEKDGVTVSAAGAKLPATLTGDAQMVDGPDGPCVRLNGKGYVKVDYHPSLDLRHACTLEAWICPHALGGRLIDRGQPGTNSGYMFDSRSGLRTVVRAGMYSADPQYRLGEWMHVAMTFDTSSGTRLYARGKLIGDWPAGTYDAQPAVISRGYALQRFMTACAGRGAFPVKFNGSIFTTDDKGHDADYRAWGGPYWMQNTRLAYWPMLAGGDYEMMLPLFRMYQDSIPLANERTRHFFGHDGAYFPETLYFWGSHTNENYGWDRTGKQSGDIAGGAIAKHYNSNLELLALMLDYYTYTGDTAFVRKTLLPMADQLLRFWVEHYPRAADGTFRITGGQALETYGGLTNPAPDIAGLRWVLDGLLALPKGTVPVAQQARWAAFRRSMPPVPTGDVDGERFLTVSEGAHGGPGNYENPELYAIFPYRIYGVGKPDLDVARAAFARRVFMGNKGWEQDDIQAAMLGLTDTAAQYVAERFATSNFGYRFPAMWGPNYDWLPDQDHGGVAMRALQAMLLQEDGRKILLLPAWPKSWDVDFTLHAAQQTTVACRFRAGKIERLVVTPAARAKDIVVIEDPQVPHTWHTLEYNR